MSSDQASVSPEDAESRRFVRATWQDDGTLRVRMQLPPDEGVRFLAAIDAARAETSADSATRANGAMTLAESFLADGARPRRGGAPHEVVLHVSAGTSDLGVAFIENADGIGVPAETSRRLCCDASVTKIVKDESGDVLDVGRKSRVVPSAMRRALDVRDEGCCVFPGCDHRLYLDAHHIEHWADGGETKLSNLALLCRRHHTYVHEHGYTLRRGDAGFVATAPDRKMFEPPRPPNPIVDALEAMRRRNRSEGVEIDELTSLSGWNGEPIDDGEIVAAVTTARA